MKLEIKSSSSTAPAPARCSCYLDHPPPALPSSTSLFSPCTACTLPPSGVMSMMMMMRNMDKKVVVFSPDDNYDKPPAARLGGCSKKRVVMTRSSTAGIPNRKSSSPKELSISAMWILRRVGAKLAKALRLVSGGKKWSHKVSASSSSSAGLARSWSYAESSAFDSQRAEAIEDCIEFLNSSSSSSLQRSYSAASCSSR